VSAQQLTYEGVLEMFQETDRRMGERSAEFDRLMKIQGVVFDRRMQKTELQMERTSKEIGNLTGGIGRGIEHMVAGDNIIKKFQALEYEIDDYSRNKKFGHNLPKGMKRRN